MLRMRMSVFAVTLGLVVLAGGLAAAAPGEIKALCATRIGDVRFDGIFDELGWFDAEWHELSIDTMALQYGRTVLSKDDFEGRFAVAYDDDYLYIGVAIVDNVVLNWGLRDGIWSKDRVEIWMDWSPISSGDDLYQMGVAPISANAIPAVWTWRKNADKVRDGVRYAGRITPYGYTLEIAFPVAVTGKENPFAQPIRFNIMVGDIDQREYSELKQAWSNYIWSGRDAVKSEEYAILRFE